MNDQFPQLPDGVYFDLPHDAYLAQRRMSSGGIKDMKVSPATFWHRSWMNPRRKDDGGGRRDPKAIGTAYHMARLEPDRFMATYARGFDATEHPDALTNDDQVCDRLQELGETMKKKGERSAERAQRLRAELRARKMPDVQVLSALQAQYEAEREGVDLLPVDVWDDIEAAMGALRNREDIQEVLSGGCAEVTVLWSQDGVPMRARFDYLKAGSYTDVKTFSNPHDKPVERCVTDAFRYNGYYRQAVLYGMAYDAISGQSLGMAGNPTPAQRELVEKIREDDSAPACNYVFIQSDGSPNIINMGVQMRQPVEGHDVNGAGVDQDNMASFMFTDSRLRMRALAEIHDAIRTYQWARETFLEGEPWGPRHPVGMITDHDFPPSFLDGETDR